MKKTGVLVVVVASLIPLLGFIPLMPDHPNTALFSLYLGTVSLILMGMAQFMATRFSWLQSIFGGLDRIYVLHKWVGITALGALLLHDTIDADIDGIGPETLLTDIAETMGELSLYGILILVIITIATFIPYHLWRWTHRFMGAFFALSTFHYLFILKPFGNTEPLGLYTLFFCLLGLFGYLYTLLPRQLAGAGYRYSITDLTVAGDTSIITLTPQATAAKKQGGLNHRAGQFAFLSIDRAGLEEAHPYTISSAPSDGRSLEFTIKALGDFTHTLKRLHQDNSLVGTNVSVKGPYGRFEKPHNQKTSVWIAGGIGITPFKAWAESLTPTDADCHLFYCVTTAEDAVHLSDLSRLADSLPCLHLHVIESKRQGRLSAQQILDTVGKPASELQAFFCGPKPMRQALAEGLISQGLRPGQFHYEEFEIRSGIGGRKLMMKLLDITQWVMAKRQQRQT